MKLVVSYDISVIEKIIEEKLEKINLGLPGMTERVVYSPGVYKALCNMVKEGKTTSPEVEKVIQETVDDLHREVSDYEVDVTPLEIIKSTTERGFNILKFEDRYGEPCSLQDSSLATEAAVWLGVTEVVPQVMVAGKGWIDYEIPKEAKICGRMHLTSIQLARLVPKLIDFVVKENLDD